LRRQPLIALAATLLFTTAALAQPVKFEKRHAYEGARRPAAQLATVYGVYGKLLTMPLANPLAMTMIHDVDGKSVRGMFEAACCSVVYVLPGTHQIRAALSGGFPHGTGTVSGNFAAGRVYEVEAVVSGDKITFRLRDAGTVLTYKDVMPTPYLDGTRQNSRVQPD
jgi:hypothetical protein